jgi:hypothetical protein
VRPSVISLLGRQEFDEGANGVNEPLRDGRRELSCTEFIGHSLLERPRIRIISNRDYSENLRIGQSVGLSPH